MVVETTSGENECTIRLSAGSAELITQHVAAIVALGAPTEITHHAQNLTEESA